MIDVSVITLNYKEALLTNNSVRKLLKSKKVHFEILVIDNSCLNSEAETLKKIKDPRVQIHIMTQNLGCAAGYNYGVNHAKGKYVFILNNDTEIKDSNALFKMKNFMDENKNFGAIQPKIKSLSKPNYFEYAGAAGGFMDYAGYPFCRGRIFQEVEKDRGQYDNAVPITWASTCAFFSRRDLLKKLGLFDPIYFAYAEEVDMSLKIWNSGYQVYFFPDTEVFHKGETAWKKVRGKKTYLIHRNHLFLYFKCLQLKDILFLLPMRIGFEFMSMIHYLIYNSNLHIIPVVMANLEVFFTMPIILRKRQVFFQNYKSNNKPLYRRSIVIDCFLHKKKKFTMLDKKGFTNYENN
jgi:GT2 family glycosyltransferase